ncbi:MAG: acetylglutamate kinase [Candidatus Kapabacteria bacterium]|nr:acetylglutamate kinase [Candidatus Kapabacteria bacterium]
MKKKPLIVFKYGGNAMTNDSLKVRLLENIVALCKNGFNVIISHGGGPFIKKMLNEVKLESEFVDGLRVTTPQAFDYIEMVLKGKVNSDLVNTINKLNHKAVGLSGIDGKTIMAKKRKHNKIVNGKEELIDLGRVGDVSKINPVLIDLLLQNDFIPVIACIAADENGIGYNINGDTFAGTLAGELKAEQFIVLTDVDGLLRDKDNPESIIKTINFAELEILKADGIIQGGMIPKIEACQIAINKGAKTAKILNGTKPEQILTLDENKFGTLIYK